MATANQREAAAPGSRLARLFARRASARQAGLLAGLRIRKKLIVLHTVFSLGLLLLMIVGLKPAVTEVVDRAEKGEARTLLQSLLDAKAVGSSPGVQSDLERLIGSQEGVTLAVGTMEELELDLPFAQSASNEPGRAVVLAEGRSRLKEGGAAVAAIPGGSGSGSGGGASGRYAIVAVVRAEARDAVTRVFILTVFAIIGVYVFIAGALEVFVLPQAVYAPIESMLHADKALREGRSDEELVPESAMPSDELGEIMQSRNESVAALRTQEAELAAALSQLEVVANDLKRKNHLLETARRNLADADRLASLGMMSAGLAHELNTPLAVLKGLVERLNKDPSAGMDAASAALMLRVVGRLERLGESLLDFARARPPESAPAVLRDVVEEAMTLVRLDGGGMVRIENDVPPGLEVACDAGRMVQVLVNLVRNARNALVEQKADGREGRGEPVIRIAAATATREGRTWVSLTVRDNGPGIDPGLLPRLFEPFATTRLDSRGTGLGLAVSEGIVREHGGILLARNMAAGAEFEVMLPFADPSVAGEGRVSSVATE